MTIQEGIRDPISKRTFKSFICVGWSNSRNCGSILKLLISRRNRKSIQYRTKAIALENALFGDGHRIDQCWFLCVIKVDLPENTMILILRFRISANLKIRGEPKKKEMEIPNIRCVRSKLHENLRFSVIF